MIRLLKENLGSLVLVAMLTISLSSNVALGIKVRNLQNPQMGIRVGARIPRLPVLDQAGAKAEIRFDDGRWSVLYVMSPTCAWCARNLSNIRELASAAGAKFRFVGVSTTAAKLDEYLKSTSVPFPVLAVDASRIPDGLSLTATPQTIVIGPDGRVGKVWMGALQGSAQAEVESFFKVRLPGLPNDGGSAHLR